MMLRKQSGQGILETLIALGILVMGVVGALGIVVSSISGTEISTEKGLLTQIARESLEAVRSQRDNNWLANDANPNVAWDANLVSGVDGTMIPIFNHTNRSWSFSFAPNSISDPQAVIYTKKNPVLGNVMFTQFEDPQNAPQGWTPSKYRRLVELQDICGPSSNPTYESPQGCPATFVNRKIGIRVLVTARVGESGDKTVVNMEEHLYQWKYVDK